MKRGFFTEGLIDVLGFGQQPICYSTEARTTIRQLALHKNSQSVAQRSQYLTPNVSSYATDECHCPDGISCVLPPPCSEALLLIIEKCCSLAGNVF